MSTELGLDSARCCLDEIWVPPNDLAQVMLAVYKGQAVRKTRLLGQLQERSDARGVAAGELVSILLVDFLKLQHNDNAFKLANDTNKEVDTFMKTAAKHSSKLLFPGSSKERDKNSDLKPESKLQEIQRNKSQTRPSSMMKQTPEDRLEKIEKRTLLKRSVTPTMYEARKQSAFVRNKGDKQEKIEYLVQEKNKAEENILKAASLLKKSNKDFNELLHFAKEMQSALQELYDSLTVPSNNPLHQFKIMTYKKSFPLKEKDLAQYDSIQGLDPRSTTNELAPLLEGFLSDKITMKNVSIPPPSKLRRPVHVLEESKENIVVN